jgi:hypothetical protein
MTLLGALTAGTGVVVATAAGVFQPNSRDSQPLSLEVLGRGALTSGAPEALALATAGAEFSGAVK